MGDGTGTASAVHGSKSPSTLPRASPVAHSHTRQVARVHTPFASATPPRTHRREQGSKCFARTALRNAHLNAPTVPVYRPASGVGWAAPTSSVVLKPVGKTDSTSRWAQPTLLNDSCVDPCLLRTISSGLRPYHL